VGNRSFITTADMITFTNGKSMTQLQAVAVPGSLGCDLRAREAGSRGHTVRPPRSCGTQCYRN
jgi:hypothetical protein